MAASGLSARSNTDVAFWENDKRHHLQAVQAGWPRVGAWDDLPFAMAE
jgi:hypothetical protein